MRAIAARSTQAVNYFSPVVASIFSSLDHKGKLNDAIARQSMRQWSMEVRRLLGINVAIPPGRKRAD
jgi:hypothetical protein